MSKAERCWRWCKRNPTRVVAAGLGMVAAVVSVALLIGSVFATALQKEKNKAEQYRAELTFNNGVALCDQGDAGRGMLWMARSLDVCPDSAAELRRRIRTALPSAAATIHTLEAVFPYPGQNVVTVFSPDGKTLLFGGKGGAWSMWTPDAREANPWLPTLRCPAAPSVRTASSS